MQPDSIIFYNCYGSCEYDHDYLLDLIMIHVRIAILRHIVLILHHMSTIIRILILDSRIPVMIVVSNHISVVIIIDIVIAFVIHSVIIVVMVMVILIVLIYYDCYDWYS